MNVPTTLPFFNGTQKQASNRDNSPCVIFSPRTQLPPFQIQRPHVANDWVDDILLVDCEGNENNIEDYFINSVELIDGYSNGAGGLQNMDTLTINANLRDITQGLKTTTGAGDAGFDSATVPFGVTEDERLYFEIDLTIGSGVAPKVYISDGADTPISNEVLLVAGVNKIILTATATDATSTLLFYNDTADQANYAATVSLTRTVRPKVHEFTSVDYIQYNGESLIDSTPINEVASWATFGAVYETFTTQGISITSAINTSGLGNAHSDAITAFDTGDVYRVTVLNVVLNSGQAPNVFLSDDFAAALSNSHTLTAGDSVFFLTSTAAIDTIFGTPVVQIQNTANANWGTGEWIIERVEDMTYLLPKGLYYIKLTDGTNEWFSEWFSIQDVYENLITTISETTYDTWETSGTIILSAINLGGLKVSKSSIFSCDNDEVFSVVFFITKNSGESPNVYLFDDDDNSVISNLVIATEGINEISLTSTKALSNARMVIDNNNASNYSTSDIWVSRKYSPRFVKLQFSDTKDLHGKRDDDQTILYQESFEQECWLNTILNTPEGNRVDVGEEKNGVFIPEKIITQYKYKIIDYINRSLFEGLIRLPQHDSLTIIDEVGNEYTPDTGNIEVGIDWTTFDTGTVTILFNDGSFVRTENSEDIT